MNAKKWVFVVWMAMTVQSALGQGFKLLEFRGGYFNPKGTEAGFILGTSFGFFFDERVDLSLGIDYFHKNYTKETTVADTSWVSGIDERTVVRELEYNTTILPISASVNVRFPFQYNTSWYVGVGIAYQFLFNSENNFRENIEEKRTYKSFGWLARAGIEYNIGSRSSIFLEALYNNCRVKRNEDVKEGLPVWNEVDISGLGFRTGLRLEFF